MAKYANICENARAFPHKSYCVAFTHQNSLSSQAGQVYAFLYGCPFVPDDDAPSQTLFKTIAHKYATQPVSLSRPQNTCLQIYNVMSLRFGRPHLG